MTTPDMSETSKSLAQVVRWMTLGLMNEVFEAASADGEAITPAQYEVLRFIDRHELPSIKQVADGLEMSSAAATKAVNGLSGERGTPLVRRLPGKDRRACHLTTTAHGAELVRRVQLERAERLGLIFGRMSEPDLRALTQGLQGLLQAALTRPGDCDAACLRCGVDHTDECLIHLVELTMPAALPRC